MADVKVDMVFQAIECCKCGITFMAPKGYATQVQEQGRVIHCPNGHQTRFADVPMVEQLAEVTALRDIMAKDLAEALRTIVSMEEENRARQAKQRKARGRK